MSATMRKMFRGNFGTALGLSLSLTMAAFTLPAMAQGTEAPAKDTPVKEAPASAAPADKAADATETVSVHDDWTVRCKSEGTGKRCEAVQTLQTPDLKSILAHVAVFAKQSGPVYVVVQVPPRVWLPANVVLKVDGVPDIVLTYKHCGIACTASVELTPKQLDALKGSSGNGELVFEAGNRQPLILPVSFKGLGEAMKKAVTAG